MRELVRRGNIANRIDVRIGGLQVVVDLDAGVAIGLDTGGFEVEVVDVGGAACADQNLIRSDFLGAGFCSRVTGGDFSQRSRFSIREILQFVTMP